ncbi:MAG: hypothetical protein JWP57_129 [Spirosoma sp.]|nr:hypothetical protein [Spirosoma sp.]
MEMNLLELAKGYLSSDVVDQISTTLGEDQQDTQTALNGALPAILGGLIHKATEPGGQASVMDMVAEVTVPNRAAGEIIKPEDGAISQLSSLFDGNSDLKSRFLSMGSGIIASLFGNQSDAIASALSAESGIKQTSALSVMSLAGTVLLGVLGKQLFAGGKGQAEVGSLLSSQTNYVQAAMPSGLGSLLGNLPGMAKPGNLGSQLADMESGPIASRVAPVATPPADLPVAGIPAFDSTHTSGSSNRWLPWLLVALVVAALFYFLRGCNNDRSDTRATTRNVEPVTTAHFLV